MAARLGKRRKQLLQNKFKIENLTLESTNDLRKFKKIRFRNVKVVNKLTVMGQDTLAVKNSGTFKFRKNKMIGSWVEFTVRGP